VFRIMYSAALFMPRYLSILSSTFSRTGAFPLPSSVPDDGYRLQPPQLDNPSKVLAFFFDLVEPSLHIFLALIRISLADAPRLPILGHTSGQLAGIPVKRRRHLHGSRGVLHRRHLSGSRGVL
jgi:hypothetical protein